jgi:hypothetical protein
MPGEKSDDEPPDLIRCSDRDLSNPQWWKDSEINVVVLYAWGDPRYLSVAKAISLAGIHLIQSLDTSGLFSPYAVFKHWLRVSLTELSLPQPVLSRVRRLTRIGRDLIPAFYERRRLQMLTECIRLAAVSPAACHSISAYAEGLGRSDVADKLTVVPHPVSSAMVYNGETKLKKVLVVGRWGRADSAQKDPDLTLRVLVRFLENNPEWEAEVIGPEALGLQKKSARFSARIQSRLTLKNFLQHDELRALYAESSILLCASRFESFHIASAEAVCCGSSVVVGNHPLLASTAWFTTRNSGTLARSRKTEDLLQALAIEVREWECGKRSADKISSSWVGELHCDFIAKNLVASLG